MTVGPRRRPSQDMLNDIDDTLYGEGHSQKSPHEKVLSRAFPGASDEITVPPRPREEERTEREIRADPERHGRLLSAHFHLQDAANPLQFLTGDELPDTGRRWTGERYVRNIKVVSDTKDARYQDKYRRSRSRTNDLYRRKYTTPPRQSYLRAPVQPGQVSMSAHKYATSERTTIGETHGLDASATIRLAGHMKFMGDRVGVRGPAGPYRRPR